MLHLVMYPDRRGSRRGNARRQLLSPVVLPQLRMLPVCDLVVRGVLKSQRRSAEGAEAPTEIPGHERGGTAESHEGGLVCRDITVAVCRCGRRM